MTILRFATILAFAPLAATAQSLGIDSAKIARIDSLFKKYDRADAPGCALGVSHRDTIVLERAWGNAQLEFAVPITPTTKFEAGSVSKQFTAAAVLRLAQHGKLSLDDDVRKYVPEIPRYDQVITVRNLIHHTSGLRDWGAVMTIAGWPRGTRTYTHAHVLDILGRQRALNYPVGSEYLYSNSNYNLMAIIVERVAGESLAAFTRREFFDPLGMTNTGWRDDYTRVVPGRAQAYSPAGSSWRLEMPFENVYGNSSLLTTVGDLLRWNANLAHMRVGGAELVGSQLRRGKLTTGREIRYAGGMFVDEFAGTRELWHDGATAGYRAFLARYPDAGFAVALLCNAGDVNPSQVGRQVAGIVTPTGLMTAQALRRDTVGLPVSAERLASLAGDYSSTRTDEPLRLIVAGQRLRVIDGPALVAVSEREFTTPSGRTHFLFDAAPAGRMDRIRIWVDDGDTIEYRPAGAPSVALSDYAGTYASTDAEITVNVRAEKDTLILVSRPSARIALRPMYRDGFTAVGSTFRFTRGANGKVDGFLISSGRVRRLRFERVTLPPPERAN